MAANFTAFSSLIEITIGDRKIQYVSSFSYEQVRAASAFVFGISSSSSAMGQLQQQIGYNVEIGVPIAIQSEFAFDPNDIAIGDGTQIICKTNTPSAPNNSLAFEGKIYTFSNLGASNYRGALTEGQPMLETISFLAADLATSF